MSLVSIIVPFYGNKLNYLSLALNSIRLQTYSNFSLYLIDSSDSEYALDIFNLYKNDIRFNYYKSPYRNLSSSLNFGIKISNSKYIARFDADDICFPKRLEVQVNFLENNQSVDIVGSSALLIDSQGYVVGKKIVPTSNHNILKDFIYRNPIIHPSVLIRRSSITDYLYRDDFDSAEDLELWLRLISNKLVLININEPLIFYRKNKKLRNLSNWIYNLYGRLINIKYIFVIIKSLYIKNDK